FIRGKEVNYVKEVLSNVIKEKQAIPFRRFNSDVGHKRNMAAGRYPKKASKEILDLVNLVEANAQFKGLSTSKLIIKHINANKAATTLRFGRKRSRKAKRTNVEVIVQEKITKKKMQIKKEYILFQVLQTITSSVNSRVIDMENHSKKNGKQ
ncbi:MAG: 50S ribosomal protein L22, partial [Bacteroidetes bacterium]|nr:50S ribosomal protein L22 [Bacteroidota bacterium]